MKNNSKINEKLVVDIISESFIDNPSVLSVIKNDNKKNKRLKHLAKYVYRTAITRNGVYISSDKKGVAICYNYNFKKESINDYWNQLILVFKCIGISRVFKVLNRESYINKNRNIKGDFLYFWFFGVKNDGKGKGAARELKQVIFNESKNQNRPIYLETSVEKNKNIYEYFDFEVYHTWKNVREDMVLWFMRRQCK